MARARWLKPEILTDEKTASLSDGAYRLFTGLLLVSDDSGIYTFSVKSTKAAIFPLRPTTLKQISKLFDELSTAELVDKYAIGKKEYIVIKTFTRHQVIAWMRRSYREPTKRLGKIPPKPKSAEEAKTYDDECSTYELQMQDTGNADEIQVQSRSHIDNRETILDSRETSVESAGVPASTPPISFKPFKIFCQKGKVYEIDQTMVDELAKAYPNCQVFHSLSRVEYHFRKNHKSRRRIDKLPAYINEWLRDDQDDEIQKMEAINA